MPCRRLLQIMRLRTCSWIPPDTGHNPHGVMPIPSSSILSMDFWTVSKAWQCSPSGWPYMLHRVHVRALGGPLHATFRLGPGGKLPWTTCCNFNCLISHSNPSHSRALGPMASEKHFPAFSFPGKILSICAKKK